MSSSGDALRASETKNCIRRRPFQQFQTRPDSLLRRWPGRATPGDEPRRSQALGPRECPVGRVSFANAIVATPGASRTRSGTARASPNGRLVRETPSKDGARDRNPVDCALLRFAPRSRCKIRRRPFAARGLQRQSPFSRGGPLPIPESALGELRLGPPTKVLTPARARARIPS